MPNPWTMCRGGCEGVGVYPLPYERWVERWPMLAVVPQRDEFDCWEPWPPVDGAVIVRCPECWGSGRRVEGAFGYCLDVLHTYWHVIKWPAWAFKVEISDGFVSPEGAGRWRRVATALRTLPHNVRWDLGEQARQRRLLRRRLG